MSAAIRQATIDDAHAIAELVTSLGYSTSRTQMSGRLSSILGDDDYATLVACVGNRIVGFVGTRVGPLYESDGRYGQIMALAVAAEHQRHGIGRALISAAEAILADRGAGVLTVTSGLHRADAHAFYEANGYTFTGRRYRKVVEDCHRR
jgi:ribosomal protein S18 acetylase RimI-like enzyme